MCECRDETCEMHTVQTLPQIRCEKGCAAQMWCVLCMKSVHAGQIHINYNASNLHLHDIKAHSFSTLTPSVTVQLYLDIVVNYKMYEKI